MYSLVTYAGGRGVTLIGLTLAQAWDALRLYGRGAIFRGEPTTYARPVYPRLN